MRYPQSLLTHLECTQCASRVDAEREAARCPACDAPLWARYDLEQARASLSQTAIGKRPRGLWRWAELLPVRQPANRITLGEGDTPLLRLPRLGRQLSVEALFIKDESANPAHDTLARAHAVALSRAVELGAHQAVPVLEEGNPLTFYTARARMKHGDLNAVNLLPFHEPYRLEGEKTLAFEIVEALGWQAPDVIMAPGGGSLLTGVWKGLLELQAIGWLGATLPQLIGVLAEASSPLVHQEESHHQQYLLNNTGATIVSVARTDWEQAQEMLATQEGVFAAPEGAAALAAARSLPNGFSRIVIINPAGGLRFI